MTGPSQNEAWQVEVNGQTYEANFAELTDWIAEGSLLPDDKVRRGNLRWIEARKAPTLAEFFNAKAKGLPPPVVVSATEAQPLTQSEDEAVQQFQNVSVVNGLSAAGSSSSGFTAGINSTLPQSVPLTNPNVCSTHADRTAKHICLSCSAALCRDCVRSFGSSVSVCSLCGGMCELKSEFESKNNAREFHTYSIQKGFGFVDFAEAIAYPFKFRTSLIIGAVMFMFFSLGQAASSFGGIYMMSASLTSYMLANMLAFGVLSNTVESFAHGKIGGNFMPDFDDFSLWDDVVHPFFLSIGVYVTSFGAFILVLVIGMYLVVSSVTSHMDTVRSELETTPGTPYYSARDTLDQSEQVKQVLGNGQQIRQQRLEQEAALANGEMIPATMDQETEDLEKIQDMIAEGKKKELEAVVGKTSETRDQESAALIAGLLKLAAPLVVLGFITLLWGLFYFPAACTVAGYTQSFGATINPLIGLDTIRRLGFDYAKILFMSLLLVIASAVVSSILALILLPFDMPGVGNLPAKAIASLFGFYISVVFACILGFALFKASDRLRLSH